MNASKSDPKPSPKVFISYAWSEERKEMVLLYGERLRQDGIDVVLDQWDFSGGDDRFHFMEQSVKDPSVTKILIFSDRLYAGKADGRLGGVGAETQIFTPELYGEVKDSKCIPIACESDDDGEAYMPIYLKSRIFIDFRKEGDRSQRVPTTCKTALWLAGKGKTLARNASVLRNQS
jgi:hypothetical protein